MINKKSLISLVELPATEFGVINNSLVPDIYSRKRLRLPPRATPSLASVLKNDGWENVELISPVYNEGVITLLEFQRIKYSDVLAVSSITRTSMQSNRLADYYKMQNPDGISITGGMHATFNLEEALEHFDIAVLGEGEKTFPEVMNRLSNGSNDLEGISGIAFKRNNEIVRTEKRELLSLDDMRDLPLPFYDERILKGIGAGVVSDERGCPYDCNFCLVTETYGRTIRNFPPERVIKEIKHFVDNGIRTIFFNGDNSTGNPKKAMELFSAIRDSGIKINGIAQVSVEASERPQLLQTMRDAGITTLCIGYESGSEEVLKYINKHATAEKNKEAVKIFHDFGFWQHAMLIMGLDPETPKTFKESVQWAKQNADSVQFFVPTPARGTRMYEQLNSEKRILTEKPYLYDGQNVVVRPNHFSPLELQEKVFDAYKEFYSPVSSLRRLIRTPEKKSTIGILAYTVSGAINKTIKNPQTIDHMNFLKNLK